MAVYYSDMKQRYRTHTNKQHALPAKEITKGRYCNYK